MQPRQALLLSLGIIILPYRISSCQPLQREKHGRSRASLRGNPTLYLGYTHSTTSPQDQSSAYFLYFPPFRRQANDLPGFGQKSLIRASWCFKRGLLEKNTKPYVKRTFTENHGRGVTPAENPGPQLPPVVLLSSPLTPDTIVKTGCPSVLAYAVNTDCAKGIGNGAFFMVRNSERGKALSQCGRAKERGKGNPFTI